MALFISSSSSGSSKRLVADFYLNISLIADLCNSKSRKKPTVLCEVDLGIYLLYDIAKYQFFQVNAA